MADSMADSMDTSETIPKAITVPGKPQTVPQVVIPHFTPPPNVPIFDDDNEEQIESPSAPQSPAQTDESAPTESLTPTNPDLPRYFTRAEKRKRSDSSSADTDQYSKIVRALIAQGELNIEDLETLELAYPAEEIQGIRIPQTYKQAIEDPTYGKQ
jgi:hypothetical protein